jgi:glucose/arabinose dehydrogenase
MFLSICASAEAGCGSYQRSRAVETGGLLMTTRAFRHLLPAGIRLLAGVLALSAGVTVLASGPSAQTRSPARVVSVTEVARGLATPWGLAFLPDGTALVSSRNTGEISRVDPASGRHWPVGRLTGVVARNDSGLLGLAVSPGFEADRTAYAYYTTASDNRVVALRFSPDWQSFEVTSVVLDGIRAGFGHQGGRLAFDARGHLWITTGDASRPELAPDRASLNGKILRILPDGSIPADNPFGSPVFSTGHRNVQGIAFAADGSVYATEFGERAQDEVNLILPGQHRNASFVHLRTHRSVALGGGLCRWFALGGCAAGTTPAAVARP